MTITIITIILAIAVVYLGYEHFKLKSKFYSLKRNFDTLCNHEISELIANVSSLEQEAGKSLNHRRCLELIVNGYQECVSSDINQIKEEVAKHDMAIEFLSNGMRSDINWLKEEVSKHDMAIKYDRANEFLSNGMHTK